MSSRLGWSLRFFSFAAAAVAIGLGAYFAATARPLEVVEAHAAPMVLDEKTSDAESGDDAPIYSLVFLLEKPRKLDAASLTKVVKRVYSAERMTGRPDAEVRGESPRFMVQTPTARLLVLNLPDPYVKDREKVAAGIQELRRKDAMRTHKAWLSVDWYGELPKSGEQQAYRTIGKLAAELAGHDCLALLCPALQQMVPYSRDFPQLLRSEDPLRVLEGAENPAVIGVDENDPRILAAAEEAPRRIDEFVAAFREGGADRGCSIKAPFTEGDETEQMWVEVTAIEGKTFRGKLANAPVLLKKLRIDQEVTVAFDKITDWLYMDGEKMVGGFTVRAIKEIKKKKPQADKPRKANE